MAQKASILKAQLPDGSVLAKPEVRYDYLDSFGSILQDPDNKVGVNDLVKAFFSAGPKWIGSLFRLRNKLVSVAGLKTSRGDEHYQQLQKFNCEPGAQVGIFRVFEVFDHEVILGQDDKHLDFRVSLFLKKDTKEKEIKHLVISTIVTFNHWSGRLYFLVVKPFHRLIVPAIVTSVIRQVESNKNDLSNENV